VLILLGDVAKHLEAASEGPVPPGEEPIRNIEAIVTTLASQGGAVLTSEHLMRVRPGVIRQG
jgi:hypothetical protein